MGGGLLWWRPPCLLRQVIVNVAADSHTAVRGVLWASRGAWITLKDCAVLKTGVAPTHIDGDVVIHRSQIVFIQVLP